MTLFNLYLKLNVTLPQNRTYLESENSSILDCKIFELTFLDSILR